MSFDERSKMLRMKRFRYGCYLPVSAENTAKTCKKRRVCKMKHPTRLHGYVPRWKDGGAAANSKDGDSNTVKTNFAERDKKSASANMVQKSLVCVLFQLTSPTQRPKGKFQHLQCLIIVIKASSSKIT